MVHTSDALVIVVAVAFAQLVSFTSARSDVAGKVNPPYVVVSVVLAGFWLACLVGLRTCDRRIVGSGNMEYQRVVTVSWRLFTAVGLASFLLQMRTGRLYLAIVFVFGTLLLIGNRWAWRKWLHRRRALGMCMSRVLVVGTPLKAAKLASEFSRSPLEGYSVVGICIPSGATHDGQTGAGIPVLGDFSDIAEVARRQGVDLVAVSGADAITADAVQHLGWDLEGSGVDLSVTISLVDVAGPRFLLHPAAKLPMVFVDEPEFSGIKYWLKSVTDWVAAAALVALLSPVILAVAGLVKLTSPGPVIYKQARVGRNGRTFHVFKFRSMYQDADARLDEVFGGEVSLFYKRADDPRITPVGRTLRRYSLDELPQLFNVLRGEMSLVGPRPQIDREVAQYDRRAHRRLLVKPGMTGLWQVSGRSSLSIEDSVRLDVFYVENWTLFGDLLILLRTLKAVVGADGAV
ncbi:sugar transferase [Terrabacter sp. BE26]|uniref:sugar transferase n=1 Tax=Terrabacter sp. BE26 TaxID=2898152 RepID=UPI0035BEA1CF